MGLSEATAKSPRMISTAKSAPAIGPLKVAAIPAAAPQPTRVRSWRGGAFNKRPSQDAAAAPIWTIGPSRPTEPPDPIVIADTSVFRPSTRRRIVPPCRATASMTSGTPGPRASRPKSVISVPTMRPPSAGISARCIDHVSDAVRPPEERALEEPDQDAEDDGAGGAREPQRDRPPDHPEVTLGATLSRFQAGRGDDGSPVAFGRECTCPGRARGWPRSYCATARVRIRSPS
jgi:hypothetical protein